MGLRPRQLGPLTTFSIANDVSKYFAIIPAAFVGTYPALGALNIMGLATLLRDNLLIYGVGELVAPFIGIKLIDMLLVALGLS